MEQTASSSGRGTLLVHPSWRFGVTAITRSAGDGVNQIRSLRRTSKRMDRKSGDAETTRIALISTNFPLPEY
jgi:hypothetical protein